jgi:hypothetical protein
MWLLVLRGFGMGLAMMPIMTGGLAAVPPHLVSRAGAFNNVVQRTSAALGVAVLTAMLTSSQAQTMADRAALVPSSAVPPSVGPPGTPELLGLYAWYQQTNLQVYVVALNDVFLVTTAVSVLGVLGALLLRSGAKTASGGGAPPPAEPAPSNVSIPSPRPAPEAGPLGEARPAAVGAAGRPRGRPR